jgi:cytochrome b subunit of formate dehydrogenase
MRYLGIVSIACWMSVGANSAALGQEVAPGEARTDTHTEVRAETHIDDVAAHSFPAPPLTGSQLGPEANRCAMCHTEPALWDESNQRLLIDLEKLGPDAHWQQGVNCHDCHGGDPATTDFSAAHVGLVPVGKMRQRCVLCHEAQRLDLVKSVHAKAGARDERGRGLPLDCSKCHGPDAHAILSAKNHDSPVFLNNQVNTCGSCHREDQETYDDTVHGKGLYESGLLVTAVCADCHGAHGIYYAADRRSMLHMSNVAATCSKCHQFIAERLAESVHGRGTGLGSATEQPAAGGKIKRHPSCTDCHQGHHLLRSDVAEFRLELANSCGNCHADLSSRYALSMHGELTHQGYAVAAECADCHGGHDILPIADPNSKVAAGENRLRTCQKCHVYAVSNFAQYDPHADYKDAARYPKLYDVYGWIQLSVNILFLGFLIHASFWFVRALVERLQHGGHATLVSDEYAFPRFDVFHRGTYAALIVAFVGMMASGLALKYSSQPWGQWLASGLGGFRSASVWHHFFAVMAIVAGITHVARGVARISKLRKASTWKTVILGPDSLLPTRRDLRDLGNMFLWFVGFGRKPGFERWAYWEKLDYWAFFIAAILIGFSGLMLWYPNLFCVVLPGTILNFAKMVHSEFAIYTASFLFLIHFFHAHFRPEKFPADLSVLTGMVSEQHLRKYRPDYIARLEREGKLDAMREKAPSKKRLWLNILGGLLIFTLGFLLLVITILASLGE